MPTFECPTCRKSFQAIKLADAPHRPFCCERCKMIDLGRWLDGTYAIHETADPAGIRDCDPSDEPS